MTGTTPRPMNSPAPGRRGLSPAIIAFIVLDVLLVIAAVALGMSMSSGDADASPAAPSPSVSSSPAAGDKPSADPAPAPPVQVGADGKQIASPSGNITCTLTPEGAECAIASLAAEPAVVDGCEGVTGYVVTLTTAGVKTPCVPQTPSKATAAIPVLDYGDAIAVNNFECVSTEVGMKCSNTNTGQGFTLARAGITRF